MQEHQYLPDTNRLSIISATILLAYALTPYVNIPENNIAINIFGVIFNLVIDFQFIVSVLVAFLAAAGTDWLLRGHPQAKDQNLIQHLILPTLTAWIIGLPLRNLEVGPRWWAVLALGGTLLVLVFVAEYITVDLTDERHAPASVGLTAISFALYLFLSIAARAVGLRLYMLIPALIFPLALVCLRTLYLRSGGSMLYGWAFTISMVIAQIAMGLHYTPVKPLSFGLFLLGPAYALTSLAGAIEEKRTWQTVWIEPAIMLAILWIMAVISL